MNSKDVTVAEFFCERDGLLILGRKYRNTDLVDQPAIILCHGFMADESSVAYEAMQFAIWGFAVFTFDFCGGSMHAKSEGDTRDMSVLSEMQDLAAVLTFVEQQEYVNKSRIILAGKSQGGFVAALAAAAHPDEVAALMMFYPALCIPDDARRGQMQAAHFNPKHVPDTFRCGKMKLGAVYAVTAQQLDPWKEITPYRGPVLIVHGENDSVVSVSYARRAAKEYNRTREGLKNQVMLAILEKAEHGFRKKSEKKAALEIARNFLHGRTCILTVRTGREKQEIAPDGLAARCLRIPFVGEAAGPYLKGRVEGGVERQDWNGTQLLARSFHFRVSGSDLSGKEAWIEVDAQSNERGRFPTVISAESETLSEAVGKRCYLSVEEHREGPTLRVFAEL